MDDPDDPMRVFLEEVQKGVEMGLTGQALNDYLQPSIDALSPEEALVLAAAILVEAGKRL